jgi:hypothetical protein
MAGCCEDGDELYDTPGSQGDEYEDDCLLGCCTSGNGGSSSSETSVITYQTTWCSIPEGSHLHCNETLGIFLTTWATIRFSRKQTFHFHLTTHREQWQDSEVTDHQLDVRDRFPMESLRREFQTTLLLIQLSTGYYAHGTEAAGAWFWPFTSIYCWYLECAFISAFIIYACSIVV